MNTLIAAVAELDPQPRHNRWTSLTYCVLDAIWSIGANYDSVVRPLVWNVAESHHDAHPVTTLPDTLPADPLPVAVLLARYPDASTLVAVTNRQRTSTRGGILKADAVLRFARVLVDHDVNVLREAELLSVQDPRWAPLNGALASIPGEGAHGVRRGYFWMLCGDDAAVKPDRMVLRWLARQGLHVDAHAARVALHTVAAEVTHRLGRPVTPWMVDHAIWSAERTRGPRGVGPRE